MTSADAFQRWVAAQKTARTEMITGLHAAGLQPGRLDAPEVRPGEPVRASGYGEDRSVYTQELFAPAGEEPRTIHLGLDIFAPLGAEVFAPVPGRIHSFQVNDHPGDYGPTIILEHAPAPGVVFYTLYGHLSRDSLKDRKRGDAFMAGECIGRLGAHSENGGWPPHLHFQVMLDMKGLRGDFPGVCKRSEREQWLSICPDPRPLLGIAAA